LNISSLQDFYRGFYSDAPQGNNAFSYAQRSHKKIFIPPLIRGDIHDVLPGEEIVFSDIVDGVEANARGLKQFVYIGRPGQDIFIVDNHNHAFSCWAAGMDAGVIPFGSTLVHVDQHKDTRAPEQFFSPDNVEGILVGTKVCGVPEADVKLSERAWCHAVRRDERARLPSAGEPAGASQALGARNAASLVRATKIGQACVYANEILNVGNFIPPALKLGWFNEVVQVGGVEAFAYDPPAAFVLDIDLDIFAPVMDYIPQELKIACLRAWMGRASFITMATSPFFMDQVKAIELLRELFIVPYDK